MEIKKNTENAAVNGLWWLEPRCKYASRYLFTSYILNEFNVL